jgi:hypothetical protein
MIKYHNTTHNEFVAELTDDNCIINNTENILDLIAEIGLQGCNKIIIRENNLHKDFFRLSTGLAGDILQKFSNYRVRLAIIGDFSKYSSNSLHDFIRECNRGNLVFFADDADSAFNKFSVKKQNLI